MFEVANIGLLTAFLAGLISFVSPCVLPLVPGYLSFVAGRTLSQIQEANRCERLRVITQSLWFVLGFSTIFLILGASATAIGRLLLTYRQEANLIGGGIVILFGILMTGILPLHWLQREWRFMGKLKEEGGGPGAAYLLGVAFAFGWTPCIGPILGAILTVSASTANVSSGLALLAVYSLGLGIPFLLTAISLDRFLQHQKLLRRWGRPMHIMAGLIMVGMGVLMITGQLTALSYWLLATFPALGSIG
ncbi:cytochrome c biogenesis CcdA family protein [Modicisalibacter xianhensis]|uniref:Cytochrome c-type biogenesis protein n=1 Tax=Modicisalibacter xianhensis TaxID=442341 RepID=A0A1I3FPB6_9GAMM|nr:cytochrome c biogenesis protein CcdA [Halomonas xianhensis]SFI13063.1 cytochrome c-type biogenesis protein [Halomonas xianhensis]